MQARHQDPIEAVKEHGRILIAEDDPNIRNLLASYLSVSGFDIDSVGDGSEAMALLESADFDLAIVDIMMPGKDGLQICRAVREAGNTPILLLTALGGERDRIEGFEAGADDYVVKPFSPRELVSRVKAILRRTRSGQPQPVKVEEPDSIHVDLAAKQILVGDAALDLTASEFKIIEALAERPGVVLSRDQLLSHIYPHGEVVTAKAVDVHIHNIRQKLGPERAQLLETVRGFGYRIKKANA